MADFFDFVNFLGGIFRLVGLLVFGIAVARLTLYAFTQPERKWQLQIAVFLGFLLFSGIVLQFVSPGSGGAYALGAGFALLYWGFKNQDETDDQSKLEEE